MNEVIAFLLFALAITYAGWWWDRNSARRDARRRNQAHPWHTRRRR